MGRSYTEYAGMFIYETDHAGAAPGQHGFVVCPDREGRINALPGATFGKTHEQAMQLIDVFKITGDTPNFWHLLNAIQRGARIAIERAKDTAPTTIERTPEDIERFHADMQRIGGKLQQDSPFPEASEDVKAAILDRVENGRDHGSFIEAVALRQWEDALRRADNTNRETFVSIMVFRLTRCQPDAVPYS